MGLTTVTAAGAIVLTTTGTIVAGAISGAAAAMAVSSTMQTLNGGNIFSNDQLWQAGLAGAVSGAVMSGTMPRTSSNDFSWSKVADGAVRGGGQNMTVTATNRALHGDRLFGSDDLWKAGVAGAMTGAANAGFKGSQDWARAGRLGTDAAIGCASGDLLGSGCQSGAILGGATSGLAWANEVLRRDTIQDSQKFKGVYDSETGILYTNDMQGHSVGLDGDGHQMAGTRIDVDGKGENALSKHGTLTDNGDGTLTYTKKKDEPGLVEMLEKQKGFTGGSQALRPTLAGYGYPIGSFLDVAHEAMAGPHDFSSKWMYDSNGTTGRFSSQNPVLATLISFVLLFPSLPIAVPKMLDQYNLNPVMMGNIVTHGQATEKK